MNKSSAMWADRTTLQQDPEGIGKMVSQLIGLLQKVRIGGVPILRPLVPFNRVVANLFESGIDFAGVGIVRGLIGHHLTAGSEGRQFSDTERRERFVAGLMGMTVAGLAYALAEYYKDEEDPPFDITGFGPRDKAKREVWLAQGNRPFTMKFGDKRVSYAETPYGMILAGVGGWRDTEKFRDLDKKSNADRFFYSSLAGLQSFSSQGVLSNVGETIKMMMGDTNVKQLTAVPARTAAGFIPAQGLLRDVSVLSDPTKIDDSTFYGSLVKDVPVLKSIGTRPALNVFGDPTKIEGLPVVKRFVTGQNIEPVFQFLGKHRLTVPVPQPSIEIGQYLPASLKEFGKKQALQMQALETGMLTPDQRYEFVKNSGAIIKKRVEQLSKNAPDKMSEYQRGAYQKQIRKITSDAHEQAMLDLIKNFK